MAAILAAGAALVLLPIGEAGGSKEVSTPSEHGHGGDTDSKAEKAHAPDGDAERWGGQGPPGEAKRPNPGRDGRHGAEAKEPDAEAGRDLDGAPPATRSNPPTAEAPAPTAAVVETPAKPPPSDAAVEAPSATPLERLGTVDLGAPSGDAPLLHDALATLDGDPQGGDSGPINLDTAGGHAGVPNRPGLGQTALFATLALGSGAGVLARRTISNRRSGKAPAGRLTGVLGPPGADLSDLRNSGPSGQRLDPSDAFPALVTHLRDNPHDGAARLELALLLVQRGQRSLALTHLEHSFRRYPEGVLRILQDPALEGLRRDEDLRAILKRFHRSQQQRLWAAYA